MDFNKIVMESIKLTQDNKNDKDILSEFSDTGIEETPKNEEVDNTDSKQVNNFFETYSAQITTSIAAGLGAINLRNRVRGLNINIHESWDDVADTISTVGKKVVKSASRYIEDNQDKFRYLGKKIMKSGRRFIDDHQDKAEYVGKKLKTAGQRFADDSQDSLKRAGKLVKRKVEKAGDWAEKKFT